jgi:hypothetical protein
MTVPEARRLKDLEAETAELKKFLDQQLLAREGPEEIAEKIVPAAVRRQAPEFLKRKGPSGRAACRLAGVSRRVVGYELKQGAKDRALRAQLIGAPSPYPRFGYRCIAAMTDTKVSPVWRLLSKLGRNLPKRRPQEALALARYPWRQSFYGAHAPSIARA